MPAMEQQRLFSPKLLARVRCTNFCVATLATVANLIRLGYPIHGSDNAVASATGVPTAIMKLKSCSEIRPSPGVWFRSSGKKTTKIEGISVEIRLFCLATHCCCWCLKFVWSIGRAKSTYRRKKKKESWLRSSSSIFHQNTRAHRLRPYCHRIHTWCSFCSYSSKPATFNRTATSSNRVHWHVKLTLYTYAQSLFLSYYNFVRYKIGHCCHA